MSEQNGETTQPEPKKFLGMPASWDTGNWYKGMWNAEDSRLFPPKRVGIGWTINFRELLKRIGILS